MLTVPPDDELEAPARATRAFSVAVAGLLIASVPEAALCGPKFAQSLAAPWVDARAGRIDTDAPAPVKTGEVDAKTWAQRTGDVISHYDFGVRATNAAKYHVKADPPKKRAVAEEDVALLKKELDKLQAAGLGLDAAANAFAVALAKNASLESLRLDDNDVGADGCAALLRALDASRLARLGAHGHVCVKSNGARDADAVAKAAGELAGDGGRDNYFVFAASLVVREASFPRLAMDRSHCETHRTCAQFSGQ